MAVVPLNKLKARFSAGNQPSEKDFIDLIDTLAISGLTPGGPLIPHKTSHQDGGNDEINVAGLNGQLADPQTPSIHDIVEAHGGFPGGADTYLRSDGQWAVPPVGMTSLSGDVTTGGGATQLPTGRGRAAQPPATPTVVTLKAISNAKLAEMPPLTIKGNGNATQTTMPRNLVSKDVTAMLDTFTPTLKGLVPPSGGDPANFLRADGLFAAPNVGAADAHAVTHQDGSTDEINVGGLSGQLADPQIPLVHDIITGHNFPGGTTTFLRGDGQFTVPPDTGITQLTGDVTAGPGSGTKPATIANRVVTVGKFQSITDNRLLGRSAGTNGDMQEITIGTGLNLAAGVLSGYRVSIELQVDVSSLASVNFQDITGLSFPVTAGVNRRWVAMIMYTASAVSIGVRVSCTTPGSTLLAYNTQVGLTANGATNNMWSNSQCTEDAGVAASTSMSTTAGNLLAVAGFIRPSASGIVQLRFAPETATAGGIVIKAGSTLEYW